MKTNTLLYIILALGGLLAAYFLFFRKSTSILNTTRLPPVNSSGRSGTKSGLDALGVAGCAAFTTGGNAALCGMSVPFATDALVSLGKDIKSWF